MRFITSEKYKRIVFGILAALFVCLAALKPAQIYSGYDWFRGQALERATTFTSETGVVFLQLSSLKALLAVIEDSTVGFSMGASFSVEIGDVVQPAYDYLNFSWELILVALLVNSVYEILFQSSVIVLGFWLAAIGSLLIALNLKRYSTDLVKFGLLFSVGFPIIFISASYLSKFVTTEVREAAVAALQQSSAKVGAVRDQLFALTSEVSITSPSESAKKVVEALGPIGEALIAVFFEVLLSSLRYVVALFLDLAGLPLLLGWLVLRALRT